MTGLFEEAYDTITGFLGTPVRATIGLYRNTTEAITAVMYSLLTEFRDGDNVVTTALEHNSHYVPWYALSHRGHVSRNPPNGQDAVADALMASEETAS